MLIASTEFASLGYGEATAFGLPSLPLILVQHPFGTLSVEEAQQAADSIMEDLIFAATGPAPEIERLYRERVPKPSRMAQHHG